MVFYSETFSTHYVALSEIPYSAWGFQDFLNSVKNAVLMPENAKKNHKEIGYPVVPCIRPDFDWLFDIYLFIEMKNSKSKNEEKISNFLSSFLTLFLTDLVTWYTMRGLIPPSPGRNRVKGPLISKELFSVTKFIIISNIIKYLNLWN